MEYVLSEWNTMKKAPILVVVIMIVGGSIAWYFVNWRYSGIVETMNQRLALKEDQITDYRERLHLLPTADQNAFSVLTNNELKQKSLRLVSEIRELLSTMDREDHQIMDQEFKAMSESKNDDERKKIWYQFTNQLTQSFQNRIADFDKRFKVDAILLRDELLSRLPVTAKNEKAFRSYELPVNTFGIRDIADDLERLAKSLT